MKLLAILLLLQSCVTTAPVAKVVPLPEGVYRHAVDVHIKDRPPMHYDGVLRVKDGALSLALLSPVGTTLLRVRDHLAEERATVEIYQDELKTQEDRIRRLYVALKPALVATNTASVEIEGYTAVVQHADFDGRGVPRLTTIAMDGLTVAIEVQREAAR